MHFDQRLNGTELKRKLINVLSQKLFQYLTKWCKDLFQL